MYCCSAPPPAPTSRLCGPSESFPLNPSCYLQGPQMLAWHPMLRAPLPEPLHGLYAEGEPPWPMPWLLLIILAPLQVLRRAPLHG